MTRAIKYVAPDVHQATTLASIRTETGQMIVRSSPTVWTRPYRNSVMRARMLPDWLRYYNRERLPYGAWVHNPRATPGEVSVNNVYINNS
jgi:hypothetical protein